jgi:hypothetical protein
MRILFDQGTPLPLRKYLTDHSVVSAYEMGWSSLENGDLLAAAESEGFNVLITTDQNLRYQQNLSDRRIAIIVLLTTNWPRIERNVFLVVDAIADSSAGKFFEITFP